MITPLKEREYKRMKKLITISLAVLLILSLSACGSSYSSNENSSSSAESDKQVSSIVDASDITLADLTDTQLLIFKDTAYCFVLDVKEGGMSLSDLSEKQEYCIDDYIILNELPSNGRHLFNEWKESVDYYGKLAAWLDGVETVAPEQVTRPEVTPEKEVEKTEQGVQVQQPASKPKPSESQVKDQVDHAQSKPITPSNNTPAGEVIGTPGKATTASGGKPPVWVEEIGCTFDYSLAEVISIREGISLEEALQRVENGEY